MTTEELQKSLVEHGYECEVHTSKTIDPQGGGYVEFQMYTCKSRGNIVTYGGEFDATLEIRIAPWLVEVSWVRGSGRISMAYTPFIELEHCDALEEFLYLFFLDCRRKFKVNMENYKVE